MSDTIHLACLTCKVQLWVGQGGYRAPAKAYLYGTDEARTNFGGFYDEHMGHDIRLTNLEGLDHLFDGDWVEYGGDDEESPLEQITSAINKTWDDPTPLPPGTVVHIGRLTITAGQYGVPIRPPAE